MSQYPVPSTWQHVPFLFTHYSPLTLQSVPSMNNTTMGSKEILQYVKSHSSGKVKIAFTDMDGIMRGKYISAEKFSSSVDNGTSFCDVIFGWDAADAVYDNVQFTGWHTGYPDCPARFDLSTFRKIPWENGVPFFFGRDN